MDSQLELNIPWIKIEFSLYNRILCCLVRRGYKGKALSVLRYAMGEMKNSEDETIRSIYKVILFYECIMNIRPCVYIRNIRKSRKTVEMPTCVSKEQQIKKSLLWLKHSTKRRKERTFKERLHIEFLECFMGGGDAATRKFEDYKIATDQRPFLHILELLK